MKAVNEMNNAGLNDQPESWSEEQTKRGLAELFATADSRDVTRTAADLEMSVEQVRRYLRGKLYDIETAKKILNHLRPLVVGRCNSVIEKLTT